MISWGCLAGAVCAALIGSNQVRNGLYRCSRKKNRTGLENTAAVSFFLAAAGLTAGMRGQTTWALFLFLGFACCSYFLVPGVLSLIRPYEVKLSGAAAERLFLLAGLTLLMIRARDVWTQVFPDVVYHSKEGSILLAAALIEIVILIFYYLKSRKNYVRKNISAGKGYSGLFMSLFGFCFLGLSAYFLSLAGDGMIQTYSIEPETAGLAMGAAAALVFCPDSLSEWSKQKVPDFCRITYGVSAGCLAGNALLCCVTRVHVGREFFIAAAGFAGISLIQLIALLVSKKSSRLSGLLEIAACLLFVFAAAGKIL